MPRLEPGNPRTHRRRSTAGSNHRSKPGAVGRGVAVAIGGIAVPVPIGRIAITVIAWGTPGRTCYSCACECANREPSQSPAPASPLSLCLTRRRDSGHCQSRGHCEAHSPAGERHGGRASRGRGRHGNEGPGGATAGDDRKMNNEPLEREPIDRVRARLEALLKANAAPRCGARSKRTGKPCRGAAMPNGRCKLHGGKSTGPRTPEGLERSRRANWKHGHFSREAKAERSRVRAAILAVRYLRDSI